MKTCPHTLIVGLSVLGDKYTTNGKGPLEDPVVEGEQGDVAGVEVGTAKAEWENSRRSAYTGKILYLLKVMGVLKFPVSPEDHLSEFARNTMLQKDNLILCHESVCSSCEQELLVTEEKHVLAVTQVSRVH